MARIDGIKLKAEWANQHIGYLNVALTSFGARLYEIRNDFIGTEINPQTQQKRFYIKKVPAVPSNISLITADILGNLRSALDHLAYGMAGAISPGGIVDKPKEIYFPIADTSDKYMLREFRRKVERLGEEAVKRLDLIKPYQGGNGAGHVLWQLDQLNNLAKHRLLVYGRSAVQRADIHE